MCQRAKDQFVTIGADLAEAVNPCNIDERVGAFYLQLHEVNDSCAACQKARRVRSRRDRVDGLGRRCRFEMIEALHRSALPPGSLLDRRDDAGIGATSAEVAAHVFADLISGAGMSLMDASDRGHDLARCAIAALQRV